MTQLARKMADLRSIQPGSYLHDFKFHSILYGEPFLFENILWYFDGKNARIVGYDLDLQPVTRDSFLRVANSIISNYNAQTITLESPDLVSGGRDLSRFRRHILYRPREYDYEVFVDRSEYVETARIRSDIRKAENKGLVSNVHDGESIVPRCEHVDILRDFVVSFAFSAYYQTEFITAVLSSLVDPSATVVEAYAGGKLRGYGLARRYNSFTVFNALLLRRASRNGVSDVIYRTLIHYFFEHGVDSISLGNCQSKGLYDYKVKWGKPKLRGTYEIIWVSKRRKRIPLYLWLTNITRKLSR